MCRPRAVLGDEHDVLEPLNHVVRQQIEFVDHELLELLGAHVLHHDSLAYASALQRLDERPLDESQPVVDVPQHQGLVVVGAFVTHPTRFQAGQPR